MHRILIIDDNQAIHDDFRKILTPKLASSSLASARAALFGEPTAGPSSEVTFEVHSALQGELGFEMVRKSIDEKRPYAVAFVDMRMPPGWDGLHTVEKLWGVDPLLQVVICSAYSDHSWEQIRQRLGLTDRLLILKKPFDPAEVMQLASALSAKWQLKQQASVKFEELERLVAQRTEALAVEAARDRLTGLPNRSQLREFLTLVIDRFRDEALPYAVLFLDFDRFKVVNDSLGHEAGDQLLVEIARRLSATLKDLPHHHSLAARLGGDEFVVAVQGPQAAELAGSVGDLLLVRLGEPYMARGYNITTTASIGIATSACRYETADELLRDADIAMYHAKAAGKARCVTFDQKMHQQLKDRLALESDLRGVTERGELALYYQPIVEVESGRLEGFEALVRWTHPVRGLVSPAEFIPVAEECGEIHRIGLWVLNNACRQLSQWRARFPRHENLCVSVNVSAKQLSSRNIVSDVAQALASAQLPPHALAIEITESAVIEDPEFAIAVLRSLSNMGVNIHLDDFGTGYTSFSYLHKLPLNRLKLDRAFMRSVSERRDYAAVVQAIVSLAHNLDIEVVAEGVETMEQVAMLLAIDCTYAQGYLFGRPVPSQEAATLISAESHRVVRPESLG
ncbi:MAG TPA: EAL domain-containing protein [Phycisphaerales bacterium]|nr:EAL domain-containing protein [Phycisphaerales bacterium]